MEITKQQVKIIVNNSKEIIKQNEAVIKRYTQAIETAKVNIVTAQTLIDGLK